MPGAVCWGRYAGARLLRRSWVVIDEVQKVPALLDEVHRLMESRQLRFILSGSTARRLRRSGGNLLAGRAMTRSMFPVVTANLSFDFDLKDALVHGALPMSLMCPERQAYRRSYAETYLDQGIRAEALIRALSGRMPSPLTPQELGPYMEAYGLSRDPPLAALQRS